MEMSLAILGGALGGGLLLLHGFGKSKAIGQCMLDTYAGLLARAKPREHDAIVSAPEPPDKQDPGAAE